jgi:hypothetical protein
MKAEERLTSALRSPDAPRTLRSLVRDFSEEGRTKGEICELLERFVMRLRTEPGYQETDEDVVLDVLDGLTGFCHPSAQILAEDKPGDQKKEGRSRFPE